MSRQRVLVRSIGALRSAETIQPVSAPTARKWTLTQEAFDQLLASFAPDRDAAAQKYLDQARELGQRFGERILFNYHFMLQSRVDLGRGDVAAARRSLEDGVKEARAQGSLWMEIRLVGLLCELPDVTKQDLAELKKVYERLPEGFSTAVVSRAREVLQNASASA